MTVTPITHAHTIRARRHLSAQTLALYDLDREIAECEQSRSLAFQRLVAAPAHEKAWRLETLESIDTVFHQLEAKRNRVLGGVAVKEAPNARR